METLKKILPLIWKYRTTILLAICVILAILFLKECRGRKEDNIKSKQNEAALNEGIRIRELKNGELVSEKAIFVGKEKDLKELNEKLYKEIQEFKKSGIKPTIIINTEYEYVDSGRVKNQITHVNDDLYSTDFSYISSDGVISIKGRSRFYAKSFLNEPINGKYSVGLKVTKDSTIFDNITFKSGLILGIEQGNDGVQRIVVKPNPYTDKIQFTDVDAAVLDDFYKNKYSKSLNKNEKRVSIGPYVGYGLSVGNGGIVRLSPQFGIGMGYSLIRF